jgi:uncharacterized membrane protein
MQFSQLHYLPLAPLFFAVLIGIFFLVLLLIQLGILRYAYMRLGVSSTGAFMLLAASLLGSYFNIPVWHLPAETVSAAREIDFFGVRYVVPTVVQWPGTIIAVNVGGAVIPTLMSIYLLVRNMVWIEGAIATAIVTAVTHWLAEPVPGVGIAEPIFVPAAVTAIVSVLLSYARAAPEKAAPLAYISGSLGTLIGADLLNLDRINGLGAPVASIGGAGTFDGIFITGILAVLLASISGRRPQPVSETEA